MPQTTTPGCIDDGPYTGRRLAEARVFVLADVGTPRTEVIGEECSQAGFRNGRVWTKIAVEARRHEVVETRLRRRARGRAALRHADQRSFFTNHPAAGSPVDVSIVKMVREGPSIMSDADAVAWKYRTIGMKRHGARDGCLVPYGGVACGSTTMTRLPRVVAPIAL